MVSALEQRHRTERKPNELSKESQPCRLLQFGLLLLPMPHVRHSFSSLGYDCVQRQRLRGQGKPPPLQRNNWLVMASTRHTTPLSFGIAGAVESACGVALIKSRILPLCDSHVTPHHPFHVPCAPLCLKITQHQLSGREKWEVFLTYWMGLSSSQVPEIGDPLMFFVLEWKQNSFLGVKKKPFWEDFQSIISVDLCHRGCCAVCSLWLGL